MIFSQRDIEILKLIRWCQFILPDDLNRISTEEERKNLADLGLIRQHNKSGALLLQSIFGETPPKYPPSYHTAIIQRRIRRSKLALTAYSGNTNIFLAQNELLSNFPSLFLSTLTIDRGSNPWGSTRVAAIAHLGDLFCAVHYVCPGIGKIALTDELTTFSNQTARFPGAKRTFLFAGESYQNILSELEADAQTDSPAMTLERCSFKSWRSLTTAAVWHRLPAPYVLSHTQFLTEVKSIWVFNSFLNWFILFTPFGLGTTLVHPPADLSHHEKGLHMVLGVQVYPRPSGL